MITVLEIGHIVAGPTAGLILSDLGFNVIKIEKPKEGDIARRLTGPSSGAFPMYNRNKKSLTLDLNLHKGREIFLKLATKSDIIIDNLGSESMRKFGLSYKTISALNKRVIYLSLKGYASGPYEMRKALDFPVEVQSGLAYMTGLKEKPLRVGGSVVDIGGALFGVIAVLKALLDRKKNGHGKFIEVGLFETAVFLVGQHIATFQINKAELKPINEEGFAWAIYDFFPTKDKKEVFIAITTNKQWNSFCSGFRLDLCGMPEYISNESRYQRREFLKKVITEKTSKMGLNKITNLLAKVNVSYAVLSKPWDLLKDPHMAPKMATELFESHSIKVPYSPLGCSSIKNSPPHLGENSEEILSTLGFSKEQIRRLRSEGVT